MENSFFWIIGGGLMQVPLVREVKDLGYSVVVTDLDPDCPCKRQADLFYPVDVFDIEKHLDLAVTLVRNGHSIKAVLAAGIDAPETAARLCEKLNLPGVASEIARLVHNKHLFRKWLKDVGYPVPRFAVVNQEALDSVKSMIDEISCPFIVKNTDSAGSRGTRMFDVFDQDEVIAALRLAFDVSRSGLALIESVWKGSEHTVETIFDRDGKFHPCFITDRHFDKRDGYLIETGLRHPSVLSESDQDSMYDLAYRVAKDLKISIGAAKYDMMMTENGPRIIEMTVRLSGGFDCQYLVPVATGKNVLKAAVLTALGQPFDISLLKDKKHRVALSRSIWPEPGKIVMIEGVKDAQKVEGVEEIIFRNKVGDIVAPYTDCTKRVCFYIVSGQTEQEAQKSADCVKRILKIKTELA